MHLYIEKTGPSIALGTGPREFNYLTILPPDEIIFFVGCFMLYCAWHGMLVYLYESLCKGLFFKDFQSSLWSGKKYAPAMPVYMKVSVRDCFLKTFNLRCGRVKNMLRPCRLYESLPQTQYGFHASLWGKPDQNSGLPMAVI